MYRGKQELRRRVVLGHRIKHREVTSVQYSIYTKRMFPLRKTGVFTENFLFLYQGNPRLTYWVNFQSYYSVYFRLYHNGASYNPVHRVTFSLGMKDKTVPVT